MGNGEAVTMTILKVTVVKMRNYVDGNVGESSETENKD